MFNVKSNCAINQEVSPLKDSKSKQNFLQDVVLIHNI